MASRDILGTRRRNRVEDFTDRWRGEGYSPKTTPPGRGLPGKPTRETETAVVFFHARHESVEDETEK